MTQATAREKSEIGRIFSREFNGQPNIMTPIRGEFGHSHIDNSLLYEISHGEGLLAGTYLYGVTVLQKSDNGITRRHDLSKVFSSEDRYDALSQARVYAHYMEDKMTQEELIKDIEETAAYCREQGQYVKINNLMSWVEVYRGPDDEYFFQGDEAGDLLDEVPDWINGEDFILWSAQGW